MNALRTKREMYAAWFAGRLGNRPRVWLSLEDLLDSEYRGTVWVRDGEKVGSPLLISEVPVAGLQEALCQRGGLGKSLIFGETLPDEHRTIQGEVMRVPGGVYFRWTDVKASLREAFAIRQYHSVGLSAKLLLERYLDPASYDDLMDLLDDFQDHVVELTAFDIGVGENPTRNTIFWEVRLY